MEMEKTKIVYLKKKTTEGRHDERNINQIQNGGLGIYLRTKSSQLVSL